MENKFIEKLFIDFFKFLGVFCIILSIVGFGEVLIKCNNEINIFKVIITFFIAVIMFFTASYYEFYLREKGE